MSVARLVDLLKAALRQLSGDDIAPRDLKLVARRLATGYHLRLQIRLPADDLRL